MLKLCKAALAASFMCFGFQSTAATVTEVFSVEPTINKLGNPVSFGWEYSLASGLSAVFNFKDPGTFTLFDDGTATIVGKVYNDTDMASGFEFSMELDNTFLQTPVFKAAFVGVTAHGNEKFLDLESGVLTGFGVLDGLDMTISRFPVDGAAVFQYGGGITGVRGPNQHSPDFGISGWFGVETVTSSTCAVCSNNPTIDRLAGSQADLVANLTVTTVPVPAGGVMLLSALGAVWGVRRRKRT